MPVYDPVLRAKLRAMGYDPEEASMTDPSIPAPEQQQPSKEPEVGRIRSVLSNALASIPSAGAALAAGAATGSALAPAAAIPVIGPAIPLVGGIGAAIAAGMGARKLQDKAIEAYAPAPFAEGYKSEMANTQAAHPYYSALGEILGSGPFMRPSVGVMKSAGRAITNPLRGNPASVADKANLLNVGVGAAAPVAINVAQNGTEAFDDPKRLAMEIVGGGMMNTPWALGKKIGMTSPGVGKRTPTPDELLGGGNVNPIPAEKTPDTEPVIRIPPDAIPPKAPTDIPKEAEDIINKVKASGVMDKVITDPLVDSLKSSPILEELRAAQLPNETSINPENTSRNATSVAEQPKPSTIQDDYRRALAEKEAAEVRIAEETRRLQEQAAELKKIVEPQAKQPVELPTELLQEDDGILRSVPGGLGASLSRSGSKLEHYAKWLQDVKGYTPTQAIAEVSKIEEATGKTSFGRDEVIDIPGNKALRDAGYLYQEFEKTQAPRTQNMADYFANDLGPTRNIRVENRSRVRKDDGTEVKGSANLKDRVARINPNKASQDTDAHELFEIFYPDLEASKSPRDRALTTRANRVFAQSEGYKEWVKTRGPSQSKTVKEYLTTRTGEDSVRRLLNTDGNGAIKEWFKDFWSYQKTKFNKATEADFARVLSNRLVNDPAYTETFGKGASNINPVQNNESNTSQSQAFSEGVSEPPVPGVRPNGTSAPVRDILGLVSKVLKSEVEKVRANKNPKGRILADAFEAFYDTYNRFKGSLGGTTNRKIREAGDYGILDHFTGDNKLLAEVTKKMFRARDGEAVEFTPAEQKVRAEAQKLFKAVRDEMRKRPSLPDKPEGDDDPNYIPHITKLKAIETIRKNQDSPESRKLKQDFIRYQRDKLIAKGADFDKATRIAQDNLKKLLDGYSKKTNDIAENYGPIDKAEGYGLPESWREDNLQRIVTRYTDRVARRLAYEDTINTKPEAKEALETLAGDTSVDKIISDIRGNSPRDEKLTQGIFGIVRAANLGTLTGAKDFISGFTQGMQHQQNLIQTVKVAVQALGNLSKYIADAVDTGRIRENINALEWNEATGAMRRIQDVLSDVQGRNFLEKITRGITMGIGELTTLDFHAKLRSGNKTAKAWFENFGKDVDTSVANLSPKDVKKIAARFVDSAQGTYDYRGLPDFAMHGQWSPLFSLARWNIEKANNYNKYVLNPMLKGNFRPFLMSTVGMVIGGSAVNLLVEQMTGRKEKAAEVGEMKAAAEGGQNIALPILYKAIGLASLSGYAGILTDVAKSTMDRMYAKVKPRWYNNMLIDSIDNIQENIANYLEAVNTDGATIDNTMQFVTSVLNDNLQAARLVFNHVGDKKVEIEQSNKIRDLRSFRLLHGEKVSDLSDADYSKKFVNADAREFKKEQDIGEAAKMIPELVSSAIERAKDKSGRINPERLKEQLTALKRNSYQTMPNPNTIPDQFLRYLNFLEKTQGKEERDKRLVDYLQRNAINQAKSKMVP